MVGVRVRLQFIAVVLKSLQVQHVHFLQVLASVTCADVCRLLIVPCLVLYIVIAWIQPAPSDAPHSGHQCIYPNGCPQPAPHRSTQDGMNSRWSCCNQPISENGPCFLVSCCVSVGVHELTRLSVLTWTFEVCRIYKNRILDTVRRKITSTKHHCQCLPILC
jgi:hypothetical protein